MELKTFNEIRPEGIAVLMPSGIRAKLFMENDNVIVEYPEMYRDKYTKEQFKKVMEEGIQILGGYTNIAQQSVLMESKETVIDKLAKKGFIRPALLEAFEKQEAPGALFTVMQGEKKEYITPEYKNELLTLLDRIAKEYPNVKVRQQALIFIDALGLQEYFDIKAMQDFIKKYTDVLSAHVMESLTEDFDPLAHDAQFRYMLLSRLKQDCEYFLGNGNGYEGNLWAGSVEEQIKTMRDLWNSFDDSRKPEWISRADIDEYETKMMGKKNFEKVAKMAAEESLKEDLDTEEDIFQSLLELADEDGCTIVDYEDDDPEVLTQRINNKFDTNVTAEQVTKVIEDEIADTQALYMDMGNFEESVNEEREITKKEWDKTPKDYKTIIKGKKYKMFHDEKDGTILAPVKIVDESLKEEFAKAGDIFYSADGQDKLKVVAVKGDKNDVVFEDGTKLTVTDDQIRNFMQNNSIEIIDESLNEGTWSIPFTVENAQKLKRLMEHPITPEEAMDGLYSIMGDDKLFDDLTAMRDEDAEQDVRPFIKWVLNKWVKQCKDYKEVDKNSLPILKTIIDESRINEAAELNEKSLLDRIQTQLLNKNTPSRILKTLNKKYKFNDNDYDDIYNAFENNDFVHDWNVYRSFGIDDSESKEYARKEMEKELNKPRRQKALKEIVKLILKAIDNTKKKNESVMNELSDELVNKVTLQRRRNHQHAVDKFIRVDGQHTADLAQIHRKYADKDILAGEADDEIDAVNKEYEPIENKLRDEINKTDAKYQNNKRLMAMRNARLKKNESLNEEGPFYGNEGITNIALDIENGEKVGFEPLEFGNWILQISNLDSKWESLTNACQEFILEKIAMPISDGYISYKDLEIYVSEDSALDREDVEGLQVFTEEDLDKIFNEHKELKFLLSYELQFDGELDDTEDLLDSQDKYSRLSKEYEAFKEKCKKKKKQKIDDSISESVNEEEIEHLVKDNTNNTTSGPYATIDAAQNYINQQIKLGRKQEEFEVVTNNGDNNMSKNNVTPDTKLVTESYKVYHTQGAEVVSEVTCDSWQGVEEYLNQTWGDYRASMVKENPEFGTQEDQDAFFGGFEIEPVECEVIACDECPEECPDCEPCEEPCEEPIEEDLEEPVEGEEAEEGEEKEATEIVSPEEAKDEIEKMEDILDSLEDFIKELIEEPEGSEEESEEEEIKEPMDNMEAEEQYEDYHDGMLTDVSQLDMPDAIAQSIDVNDDGTVMRLTDLMNQIKSMKSEMEKMIQDFKTDMKDALGGLQQTIQRDVNDVDNKVQDTKSAIDNLTTEEEADLEDVEFNEPLEEPEEGEEAPEETEEPESPEEEQVEESVKSKGAINPIFEAIETVIGEGGKTKHMVLTELKEKYGYDYMIPSMSVCINGYIEANKLNEKLIGTDEALRIQEEQNANSAVGRYLKRAGKGKLQESLEDAKKKADELISQGKDAEEIKDAITLLTDNDEEKKQAADYAVSKMKESLLKTSKRSKLGGLGQVGE